MKHNNIKSSFISENIRFNAGYYLNDDALNSYKIESHKSKCQSLYEMAVVFNPPIFKRQFCQNTERAVQYCQSSDVTNALEGSEVFINKIQAEKVGSIVKENQILITGFGTIGNTRLVNELSDGISYANNVCRIEANNNIPYGYIYAFMTSKYGRAQVNKNASGSVVRYIEAPGIKQTLVPLLSETKQQQIHQLIVDASALRVEANKLLKEAVTILEEKINLKINTKVSQYQFNKVKFKDIINNDQKRIDSPVYITSTKNFITHNNKNKKLIELGFKVYRPGIFKRVKVEKENGMPYIKGSELSKFNPFLDAEYLSHTKTPYIEEMLLKSDQILLTCAGSVGIAKIITKEYEENKAIGSQDIIRIQKDQNSLSINYLFTYLKTDFAFDFLNSIKYGSVIERLEPFHVESIPVLIPDKDLEMKINQLIDLYKENYYQSFKKENQAIDLIEKEIDAWQ